MANDFKGSLERAELEDTFFLTPRETQKDMKQSRFRAADLIRKQEQLKSCLTKKSHQ